MWTRLTVLNLTRLDWDKTFCGNERLKVLRFHYGWRRHMATSNRSTAMDVTRPLGWSNICMGYTAMHLFALYKYTYTYIYMYTIQIYTHPHTHAHCSLHDTTIYTWAVSPFHGQTLIQHIWRPWRLKPRGRLWTFSYRPQIGQECFPCFLPADFSGTSCFSNMECI